MTKNIKCMLYLVKQISSNEKKNSVKKINIFYENIV